MHAMSTMQCKAHQNKVQILQNNPYIRCATKACTLGILMALRLLSISPQEFKAIWLSLYSFIENVIDAGNCGSPRTKPVCFEESW